MSRRTGRTVPPLLREAGRFLLICLTLLPGVARAQEQSVPVYLRDRGAGVSSSLAGIYIEKGQLLIHPFYAYTWDHNREYQPDEFGVGPDVDFRGRHRGHAAQFFIGYGLTDWLAVEIEAAYLRETFRKAQEDTFPTPAKITESGVADIEGQLRLRALRETGGRPEIFGFVEITARTQPGKFLIGDEDWDARPGVGLTKGFAWGTLTTRVALEYNHEEKKPDLGEFALGYLKRLSPALRVYLGFEGGEGGSLDEWEFIPSVQWNLSDALLLRLESPLGISSKAADWSPQVGLVLTFPRRPK